MTVTHAKTDGPIEMLFGLRNHVLSGGSDPAWEGALFWGCTCPDLFTVNVPKLVGECGLIPEEKKQENCADLTEAQSLHAICAV